MLDREGLHVLRAVAIWRVSSLIVLSNFFNVDKITILKREYRGPIFKSSAIRSMDLLKEGAKREILVCSGPRARNAVKP